MANKKISELPAASGVTVDDLLPIVDITTVETQKATLSQVLALVDVGVTSVSADLPLTVSGSPSTPTISLTGTVPVDLGGTGVNSLASHGALVMDPSGTFVTSVLPGADGTVLVSNGTDWVAGPAVGPAGPFDSLQFNNAGAFDGSAALNWDGSYVHVGDPSGQEGLLSNNVVRFVANPAVPSLGGNEAGLGWDISVGALPALYLKLGGTGDTAIMQLQGPLGISPGLSLRYTRGGPDDTPFWIDADGGPIRIGNNSDYYTTTKVVLGSVTTPVRISDAFDLPTEDGAAGEVLTTDGTGNVSWAAVGGGPMGSAALTDVDLLTAGPAGTTLTASAPTTGIYKVDVLFIMNIAGEGGGDGALVAQDNSGGLVVASSEYAITSSGSAPSGFFAPTDSPLYAFFGSETSILKIEGYVNVTTAGTFGFKISQNGAPSIATMKAGSGVSVIKIQ